MATVSVNNPARSFEKRFPSPPRSIKEYDKELYNYLQSLIREIELSFKDVNAFRRDIITAVEQISVV